MTAPDPVALAVGAAWVATAAGMALWVWSWFGEKCPVQRIRYRDCGVVLVIGALLIRVFFPVRPLNAFDWLVLALGPVFIGAALWRLGRTGASEGKTS